MTTPVAADFDTRYQELLDRYEGGEAIEALIPEFLKLRQEQADVRVSVALGWLYVLAGQKDRALHFCKEAKSVPQGKYNHALALLAFNEKGVREKLDEAYRLGGDEGRKDAIENLKDALKRRGGVFPAAEKMIRWLESDA
ncbi:MAG: hypothetical protein VKS61_13930 [Candidatus Sericytochromatia bacterium]|nr:hypothetical protein [Candidatus Sericytochromatia bacterium]